MERALIYWIWLQQSLGYASPAIHKVMQYFGGSEELFSADEKTIEQSGIFSSEQKKRILLKNTDKSYKIYKDCKDLGYRIIPFCDPEYPAKFRNIKNPPTLIYVKGKMPDQRNRSVSIVGTRSSTVECNKKAFNLAYSLASNNIIVVSGGAFGIDTQSHKGALAAGGITLCVLGCGINSDYLIKNIPMREEIGKTGALISEYPPYTPAYSSHFPVRDRLISALSDCTILVECDISSGSFITAESAFSQGKTIFAVPGKNEESTSAGIKYIIEQGAEIAENYIDILDWYNGGISIPKKNSNTLTEKTFKTIRKMSCEKKKTDKLIRQKQKSFKDKKSEQKFIQTSFLSSQSAKEENPLTKTEKTEFKNPLKQSVRVKVRTKPEKQSEKDITKEPKEILRKESEIKEKHIFEENENKIFTDLLTKGAKTVYDTISDVPINTDDIKKETGMTITEILSAVSELEMLGFIKSMPGKRYMRK